MRIARLLVITIILGCFEIVSAHQSDTSGITFNLGTYFLIILIIGSILGLGLYLLRYFETVPGSLPIRKLGIAAMVTFVINAILIAILYREVLF